MQILPVNSHKQGLWEYLVFYSHMFLFIKCQNFTMSNKLMYCSTWVCSQPEN